MKGLLNFIVEILPFPVFYFALQYWGLQKAVLISLGLAVVLFVIQWGQKGRVRVPTVVATTLILALGGLDQMIGFGRGLFGAIHF